MRDVNSIVCQPIFEFFDSIFEFFYLLLPTFPSVLFRQSTVDIEILAQFSRNQTMSLVKLGLHVLHFQSKLHNLLLLLCAIGAFLFFTFAS
jgi:hypothetical protein